MKKITFKTLSILLAAVLLVVVLPIAAFAEDVSCREDPDGLHSYDVRYYTVCVPASDEYHQRIIYASLKCTLCGDSAVIEISSESEAHDFGDEIDPEVDMEGVCIICGDEISW